MPTTVTWSAYLTWATAGFRWSDGSRTWESGGGDRWMDATYTWADAQQRWNNEYALEPTDSRTFPIDAENRSFAIDAENRTYSIPAID